jgi:hypothetical protein
MMERKIWKRGLSILLIFQIVVALSLAVFAVINFPGLLEQFGIKHQSDMGILQIIMIYNLFLSLSICLWSVIWINQENIAGIQTGTTVGFLLFAVSMIVFLQFNRIDILLFDSLRAFLMVIFGGLAYQEHKKHH